MRRLQDKDIEDPLAAQLEDPHSSQQRPASADLSHSESSDIEQEQDFISSVVSQRQGPRVHWGDLPKRTDEDGKGERGKMERRKKQRQEGDEKEIEGQDTEMEGKMGKDEDRHESLSCKTEAGADTENLKQLHSLNTVKPNGEHAPEEESLPEEPCVEEATAKLSICSLSETVAHTAPLPVDSTATQAERTDLPTSPPRKDLNPSTESKHLPFSNLMNTNQDSHNTALTMQPGLNITQVGMSKRGAAGLRDLLKNHPAGAKPNSIRLNLLECLKRTLNSWSTEETLKFLYGADHSVRSPFADVEEEEEEEEEDELDEDDLEDDVGDEDAEGVDIGMEKRPSAAAPDYKALREESHKHELKVREFYKGSWILPEDKEEPHGDKVREGGREWRKKRNDLL